MSGHSPTEPVTDDMVVEDAGDEIVTNEHPEYADVNVMKSYTGKVGNLPAVYELMININQSVTGSYYYPKRPNTIYKLDGHVNNEGV